MGNERSAWALIWRDFCAEFGHWCLRSTHTFQFLFHPLLNQSKPLDSILPGNKIVSRKDLFSESKVRKLQIRWKKEAISGGEGMEKECL